MLERRSCDHSSANIGAILGIYRDNGKENGNYNNGVLYSLGLRGFTVTGLGGILALGVWLVLIPPILLLCFWSLLLIEPLACPCSFLQKRTKYQIPRIGHGQFNIATPFGPSDLRNSS